MRDIEKVLLSSEQIEQRVKELAVEIGRSSDDEELLVVGVLTGAFMFLADLVRRLPLPTRIVFLRACSYRDRTHPGELALELIGDEDFRGRDVLVVEDIVDTGRSLAAIRKKIEAMGAARIRAVVLLDKPGRREVSVPVEFTGFSIPEEFVVGYGLDHGGRFRALPFVGVLRRSV